MVVCISEASSEAGSSNRKPSIADLDNIFGPEQAPPAGEDKGDAWVCFSEESVDRLQTQDPAPLLPTSPPPSESLAPPLPTSPLSPEQPAPALPTSSPLKEALPSLQSRPPPSEEPAAPPVSSGPHTPEDQNPPSFSTPSASTPPKELVSPTTSSPPPVKSAPTAPKARTPPALRPADAPGTDPLSPPPVSQEGQSRVSETNQPKESGGENVTSPNDTKQSGRSTPPPPPPPTYRTMASSPVPGAAGSSSGE